MILPVDAGEFAFYDCAYEELLQALGAINDDRSVPWTMFNDDVQMGFFDVYDEYLLNILYDPRVRPGHDQARGQRALARRPVDGAGMGNEGEAAATRGRRTSIDARQLANLPPDAVARWFNG